MHSKVVIASLVCMLAASFGAGNKATSDFKKTNRDTKEMVCRAPNDDGSELVFVNDITSTNDEARAVFTSNKQIAIARVIKATSGVNVRFDYSGDNVMVYITPHRTKTKQAVAIGFTTVGKKLNATTITKTIYIYNDGQHCCYSALSESDALAKYFMNYVATPEQAAVLANGSPSFEGTSPGIVGPEFPYTPEPDPHPDPWPPFPNPNPPRVKKGFNPGDFNFDEPSIIFDPFVPTAEETYVNYIFGDKQDMEFTVSTVLNDDLPQWGQHVGTFLKAQVNWYDENNVAHPAKGVSVQFYGNGELLTDFGHIFSQEPMSYDYRTNANGFCEVDVISGCRLNMLEARVCADSSSTRVEDNFMIDYPFFARAATGLLNSIELSEYSEVSFTINVYTKKSERGEAFAISQMQNVPYDYATQFSDGIDAAKTIYPSEHTFYDGENDTIMVEPEDKKSWDVLNHEYGHYIADKLELCNVPDDSIAHGVFEDLTIKHGDTQGKQLAYNEGLATYLGIASQMYYNSRFTISGYGDEIYQDSFRGLTVNYNQYGLGQNNYANADAVEARVTSALIKLLDDVNRDFDNVSLGHQAMWNAFNSASTCDTIYDLLLEILEQNEECALDIYEILRNERFETDFSDIGKARWTFMIYCCVSDQAPSVYKELEKLRDTYFEKPADVNIILEIGGYDDWRPGYGITNASTPKRYHLENKEWVLDEALTEGYMSDEQTFESFLDWSFSEYPASKTGLMMWNHGAALDGCCYDHNNCLSMSEYKTALSNAFHNNGITKKMEFVAYRACTMQVQDVAEFNSDYSKYVIASEENMPTADHWSYEGLIINFIYDRTTEQILTSMAQSYMMAVHQLEYCISVLDLSEMENYYNEFEQLASDISNVVTNNYASFATIVGSCNSYYNGNTVDGWNFLNKLGESELFADYVDQIDVVKEAFSDLVFYNETSDYFHFPDLSHGLAFWTGLGYSHYYPETETNFNNWRSLFQYEV